ncbi:MFS transporter [Plantactinospora siamensis]|uniref:MFS transporter n=1 Tax=Plantactinospora siamensis TaxID=555372 RepID=A0ABV6P320_9ACTN
MPRSRAVWRNRNAVLFVAISLSWGFAASVMMLVAGIWVLTLSGSSSLGALVNSCLYLPVAFGPVLGGLVDRLPRRPTMISTCLATAIAIASLLAVGSAAEIWLIFVVMLGYGVSFVLLGAGESALLPAALPAELLGEVNGTRTSAQEGMKLVAPAAGAGLFAWGGGRPVVLLTVVALAATAGLYAALRLRPGASPAHAAVPARAAGEPATAPARPTTPSGAGPGRPTMSSGAAPARQTTSSGAGPGRPTMSSGAAPARQTTSCGAGEDRARPGRRQYGGLRFLLGTPELRLVVLVSAACIAMSGLTSAALYAAVTTGLHRPPAFLGVLTSAQGLGSIVGGLLAGRLIAARGEMAAAGAGALVYAGGVAVWSLPWWPALVLGSLLVGVGLPWTLVAATTAVQLRTPGRLLGRVSASAGTLLFGPVALANPLGAALVLVDRRLPLLAVPVGALLAGTVALLRSGPPRRAAGLTGTPAT